MPVALIANILEAVISDVPTLITVVEKLIAIFKENREPSDSEWAEINALCDAAHKKVQGN